MGYANKWWTVDRSTMTGFQPDDNPGLLEWLIPDTAEDPLDILIRQEEEGDEQYQY